MTKRINFLKFPGGSYYTAPWIVTQFPHNYTNLKYVETHLGGGSVFFYKKPSIIEILNDINYELVQLFLTVRDDAATFFNELIRLSYIDEIFLNAINHKYSPAANTYIKYRMSRGGLGKHFAWSNRLRGGKPGDLNAWNNALNSLYKVQYRLKHTIITNHDAIYSIEAEDSPSTLFFVDPPWLHETRVDKTMYGQYEMSERQHIELYHTLNNCVGKVCILGYKSDLYDKFYTLPKWHKVSKNIVNHAGQNKKKQLREVVLWRNYEVG